MKCPKCNGDTKVVDRRDVRRRRECLACKERFSTVEVLATKTPVQAKPQPELKPKPPVKPTPKPVISKVKRNAEARRKIERLRDSFFDPDNDFIPEKW